MNRVEPDTRRWALMPTSPGWFMQLCLALLICMNSAFAQRPFPGSTSESKPARPEPLIDTPAEPTATGASVESLPAKPREPTQTAQAPQAPTKTISDPYFQPTAGTALPDSKVQTASGVATAEFSIDNEVNEPIVDVVIEGNTTILPNAIMRYIETRPGHTPSRRLIQLDITQLLNTRWFLKVDPVFRNTPDGLVLVFKVVERPILRSVKFVGNDKIKTPELQAHTGLWPGHGFDVAANKESVHRIKSLYRERGHRFAEVSLAKGSSPHDRDVIFQIKEGPKVKIWGVSFKGNREISGQILGTKTESKAVILWVIRGDYDPEIIQQDVMKLKQYYIQLGYFDVEVDYSERFSDDKARVYLTFNIKEGQRYRVGKIDVAGNQIIGRRNLLAETELPPGKFFNARLMGTDVNFMKEQYDELGHMFAKVTPTPIFRKDQPGVVDLVYTIDEDEPRYWGDINVHITGDHPHTKEEIVLQQIGDFIVPGQLASGKDYRMAQARVRGSNLWERSQPPVFNITPTAGLDYLPSLTARGQNADRKNLLETNAEFSPAEPESVFSMQKSDVAAGKPVDDGVGRAFVPAMDNAQPINAIRQAIQRAKVERETPKVEAKQPTPKGAFNPEVIFRGQSPAPFPAGVAPPMTRGQSIDQFGNPVPQNYLQGVSPQGDPFGDALSAPPTPGFVDVNIDVTEGRTGRLMFGVGVNSDAGVVGSLVLQEDNFDILKPPRSFADIVNGTAWRGRGQSFRLEAVPGTDVSRYMVSFQDPYFMRSDFSLGLSGFYYNRFFRDWTEDRLGGRISLGYVFDRYWSATGALRMENVKIRDFPSPAPQELEDVRGDNFLSTASITLAYDTRDSSFSPSQGHNVNFTYEQGFGEFNYPRIDVGAGQYFTVFQRPDGFGKHILSFTGQLGWTGSDTPIFERFYAGGYSSFRGFEFRGVTPRETVGGREFRVGGEFMAVGSAEYMVPLTANDNIKAVVFSDFGTVEPDVGFDAFRATAGFGLRLTIPAMGPAPLAFDFAWPLMQQSEDDTRVFSFYVGFTR